MEAGDLIRQRRVELGLSQKKAAKAAGVSASTWQDYEYGGRPARNAVTTRAICGVLRWEPDALDRIGQGLTPVEAPDAEADAERVAGLSVELAAALRGLQHEVTRLVDAVGALDTRAGASEARLVAAEARVAHLEKRASAGSL